MSRLPATRPIDRPDISPRLQLAYIEATRSGGSRGLAEDMRVVLAPWGFDPGGVVAPVFVFHGRLDAIAPPTHAEYWVQTLPNAHPVWFDDAGHFLIEGHIDEILDRISAQRAEQLAPVSPISQVREQR